MHHYRQTPVQCQLTYIFSFDREQAVSCPDQSIDLQLINPHKRTRNFAQPSNFDRFNRYPKGPRGRLALLDISTSALWIADIHEQRDTRQSTYHYLEQFNAFRAQVERHI